MNLEVRQGEFVTLLGPSGSGKTTLLRIIAGLLRPTHGRVFIGERDITFLDSRKRAIGFVFQNYALFPHLTVFENVAFALKLRHVPRDEVQNRTRRTLELVRMSGFERRYPAQLSGGEQQRVALARAIVHNPSVLLMDEPLGSLDKRLRQQLQLELRRLQREVAVTTIYVTHDQEEAFAMSDRIAVMSDGVVHQFGAPEDIYRRPSDAFVAGFVGEINHFRGQLANRDGRDCLKTQSGLEIAVDLEGVVITGGQHGCGIRPEKIQAGHQLRCDNLFDARVGTMTFRGSYYWAELLLASDDAVWASWPDLNGVREGDHIQVGWNAGDAWVFPIGV